jgi:DUF971 family protein
MATHLNRKPFLVNIGDPAAGGEGRAGAAMWRRRHKDTVTRARKHDGDPMAAEPSPWPTEVKLHKDKKTLSLRFENGEVYEFPAEFLRVHSPSAEVQGHSPDERKTIGGKRDVAVIEINPVGNYAVRLVFDDLHSTGIFSWDYFLKLGREQGRLWRAYLDDIAAKGLSRDPPARVDK